MNFLFDLELNDGTDFHISKDRIEVGGVVYDDIIKSPSWTKSLSTGKFFETPTMAFKVADQNKKIRSHFEDAVDNQKNIGSPGTLKDISGNTLMMLRLAGVKYEEHYTFLKFSQNIDIIKNKLLNVITEQEYPDAVQAALGKAIPYPLGTIDGGGTSGTYSAYRVTKSSTQHFLLANCHLTSVTRVMQDGVNITSGWSLNNASDGKAYLNWSSGTADTIQVNVTRSASSIDNFFSTIFTDLFADYAYDPTAGFLARLERQWYMPVNWLSCVFTEQLKGEKMMFYLAQFCACDWYIDSDGTIKMPYLDFESPSGKESATFIESDTDGLFKKDQKQIKNKISYKFKWLPKNQYTGNGDEYKWDFTFHKTQSQDNAGIFDDDIELQFTGQISTAFGSAKNYANLYQYPPLEATVNFTGKENVEKFLDLDLGDIIKLTHSKALTTTARYYRIERMDFNLDNNSVNCTLRDLGFLENIAEHVLLIQSGYSGVKGESPYFFDFAPNCTHGIGVGASIKHSTNQKIWKSASAFFEDIQYLYAIAKSPNVFTLQDDGYNYLMGGWFRPMASVLDSALFTLYEDANNYILLKAIENNILLNGGFETAGGGGADVFANWSEYTAGTSTITRSNVSPYSGTYSCKLLPQSSGSSCYVYQSFSLTASAAYTLSLYFKCSYSLSVNYIQVRDSGSNVWLKSDGTWAATVQTISTSAQTNWTNFSLNFNAHASYTNYVIYLMPGTWQNATNTFWYDQVSIRPQGGDSLKLNLRLVDGGVTQIDVDSAGALEDSAWFFILLAKIGTDWGVYICKDGDGTVVQVIYESYASGDFMTAPYPVFGKIGSGNFFYGYGDEFFVIRENVFNLLPVVGLTDTFPEPSNAFNDRFNNW